MTADCQLTTEFSSELSADRLPIFRGTKGLWQNYPKVRNHALHFDEFMTESFFKENPGMFWYVYGDMYNKQQRAIPHKGYEKL